MADTLLIATGNRHKAREIKDLLAGTPWKVTDLSGFPPVDEPIEDGETFEANAVKKAEYYSNCLGVACIADDSGLVADALGGAPGVRSSRYAGEDATDQENNAKLLKSLESVPDHERTARFVCCAALARPGVPVHIETGVVEGRIIRVPRGANGFGYDPLFVPENHTQTFGELVTEVKQAISHRARAFAKMRVYLESLP